MEKTPIDVHIYVANFKDAINEYLMFNQDLNQKELKQFASLFLDYIEQASCQVYQLTGEPELSIEQLHIIYEEALEDITMEKLERDGLIKWNANNGWEVTQKGICKDLISRINYN